MIILINSNNLDLYDYREYELIKTERANKEGFLP